MRVYDLIWKKREGGELTTAEIDFLISGFVNGSIPEYQMSAWCMAVYFQGMSFAEATALTVSMANSGETMDLSEVSGIKVDKHSTGGVGDKTSLVLLPLVAACGVPVAKMSGRGLGHTGGTIDKLEAIKGFQTNLTQEKFLRQVGEIGIALASQTANLVPADKKLYALRDLTATIESVPLIASSIVAKKLAAGADAVVLDVKCGSGAFMRDYQTARKLAETMVEIGNRAGRKFKAIISDMNQPLGMAIGNSLEVIEAINTLKGEGPADLLELCLVLGGYMLWLAERAPSFESGKDLILRALESGHGLEKLRELLIAQGGDPRVLDDVSLLPNAAAVEMVTTPQEGWVDAIACRELGLLAMELGAGRTKLGQNIQSEVGILLRAKVGTLLKPGSVLAEVHAASPEAAAMVSERIRNAFNLVDHPVKPEPLIKAYLS